MTASGEAPVAFHVFPLGPSAFLSPHVTVTRCCYRLPPCCLLDAVCVGGEVVWNRAMACLCCGNHSFFKNGGIRTRQGSPFESGHQWHLVHSLCCATAASFKFFSSLHTH